MTVLPSSAVFSLVHCLVLQSWMSSSIQRDSRSFGLANDRGWCEESTAVHCIRQCGTAQRGKQQVVANAVRDGIERKIFIVANE